MKYIIIFLLFFQTMLSQTYDYKFANKIINGVVIKKSECKTLRVSVKEKNILVHVDASGIPKYNFHVRLLTKSKDTLLNNKTCKLYKGVRESLFSDEELTIYIFENECLILNKKNNGYLLTK